MLRLGARKMSCAMPEQIFYLHTVGPDNAAHIVHSGASVISYIAKTGIE